MGVANRCVGWVLRSPLHRMMSGAVDLIRFQGRRSGRTIVTPTQYAADGDDVVIVVGHPDRKRWWHNFEDERDVDVLIRRTWRPMRGRVVRADSDPDLAAVSLDAYLRRFPKVTKALEGDTPDERLRRAVMVRCRPR